MMGVITAIVEFTLSYPYEKSAATMADFSSIWGFRVNYLCTFDKVAYIEIPRDKFKKIFHTNPSIRKFPVPSNAESFIVDVRVRDVVIN